MSHQQKYMSLSGAGSDKRVFYLFGWTNGAGQRGDYGLNVPPIAQTFETLIRTTYLFQAAPDFTLHCRPVEMTQEQFDYLQDHDLDTEEFFSGFGPLPPKTHELDLSSYKGVESALAALAKLIGKD